MTNRLANGSLAVAVTFPAASYVVWVAVPVASRPRLSPLWTPNGWMIENWTASKS